MRVRALVPKRGIYLMPTVRKDRVLAAATLVLLLTTAWTAVAAPDNSGAPGTIAQPSEADLNARIPLPEPADVPPPTAKDVAPAGSSAFACIPPRSAGIA